MNSSDDITRLQAEHHPLEFSGRFSSLEEYCLHLMHLKSYEDATAMSAGKFVLDLGCNNGHGTVTIGRVCNRIIGLDVSPTAIKDAKMRFGDRGIDFRTYDGQRIPFADGSFDMVVGFQVIEHIADTTAFLREIARVLRPEGVALFTTPNAAIRLDPGMKPWNEFHVKEYVADELAALLRSTFADVSLKGLFAVDDLYQTERQRCQRALTSARVRGAPQRTSFWTRSRVNATLAAKTLLPSAVADLIRSRRGDAAVKDAPQSLNQLIIDRYSTRDFCYREERLDEALDLMALCRRAAI